MDRVAIVGSRSFRDYDLMVTTLNNQRNTIGSIISGGAIGADQLGARYAREQGIQLIELIPDWKRYGRGAGLHRNTDIVNQCDRVIAFWDGISTGTQDTIRKPTSMNKPIEIIRYGQ